MKNRPLIIDIFTLRYNQCTYYSTYIIIQSYLLTYFIIKYKASKYLTISIQISGHYSLYYSPEVPKLFIVRPILRIFKIWQPTISMNDLFV